MASIYRFETWIERLGVGRVRIVLQNPLTAKVEGRNGVERAFITQIVFDGNVGRVETPWKLGTIVRDTSWATHGKTGWRRKLKGETQTQDRVELLTTRTLDQTYTRFGTMNSKKHGHAGGYDSVERTSTAGLDFNADEYYVMVKAVAASGNGQMLADWIIENSDKLGPMLTEPGWMPATYREFNDVREDRSVRLAAKLKAIREAMSVANDNVIRDSDVDDSSEEDRWR